VKNKENNPILYSFRRCPYAMRARMAIAISQQQVEFREVLLRDKPPSMIEISPKGTVPVLLLNSGKVIDESLDIIDWALNLNDPKDWKRSQNSEKSKTLILTNDNEFKYHLDRYKYSKRYDNEIPIVHRKQCMKFINELEVQLQNSKYLYDNDISALDISIFPFIRQFRIADMEWFDALDKPYLKGWLITFLESDLFKSIMLKYDIWKDGDEFFFPFK
jgi:glutathione S-transferase